jgi:DNA-binding LacI/PurR family transcriptional regulator
LDQDAAVTVTLKDIARQVNRSVTTVSRALHDCADVSPETRDLVKLTAAQLGYAPNVVAQRLQKQRTETVGLILSRHGPRLSDPFFGDMLSGVVDEIARAGLDLLIGSAGEATDEVDLYRQRIGGRRVDGFWVVRTRCHDPRIGYLVGQRASFVACGRVLETWEFPYVDVDHAQGMRSVVQHLNRLGHRRVAFVAGPSEITSVYLQHQGFVQALAELGLDNEPDLIVEGEMTQRGGYDAAQVLFSHSRPATAVVASTDLMALGVMSAAQDQGLEVGSDVAVVGFDDIPLAETAHPTLTTVRQPAYHMGKLAGQMLTALAQGRPIARPQVLLEPSLIIRQSTNLDLWL